MAKFFDVEQFLRDLVKGEVEEGREINEENIGDMLGLIENENGRDVSFIDQVQQAFLEAGPQIRRGYGRGGGRAPGLSPVEIEGPYGGARIEHQVVGFRRSRCTNTSERFF